MKNIEVDDEVYAYLQSKAVPYVDSPNLTLRRLFGLVKLPQKSPPQQPRPEQGSDRKQLKANLEWLVQRGLLEEGQTLYFHDYRGTRVPGCEAIVSGKSLLWNGRKFSMSALAGRLFKEHGFSGGPVRGPAHWFNADGVSVKDLWQQHLNDSAKVLKEIVGKLDK